MLKNLILTPKQGNLQVLCMRQYNVRRLPKEDKKFQAAAESLAARGFLRPIKPYEPSSDIEEKIINICEKNGLKDSKDSKFDNLANKFVILNACFKETRHSVPNSLLCSIESVDDLVNFYMTPVDTRTPFDSLKKMDLPKNLYIQQDYVRYHPDTDTLFNGISPFPKSSTIVTGLKTRKKYHGLEAKRSWP